MNKKKYFKYKFYCNSAYYASLIAALVVGIIIGQRLSTASKAAQYSPRAQNVQEQRTYTIDTIRTPVLQKLQPVQNTPNPELGIIRHKIDSLQFANVAMQDSVAEKYAARIDKQYTLGRFFNKTEIAKLNKLMNTHLAMMAQNDDSDTLLNNIATEIMPLNTKTPLVTFESIIYITDVSSSDLAKFGIVYNSERIEGFTDAARQKTLQNYFDAYANAFTAEDEPNFEIPEFASIRQRYTANKQQIYELNRQIQEKSGH